MERAYRGLHELGYTHSVELWDGHELVGGLYGVATGGMFAGESMFSRASDAGKLALIALVGLIHRLRVPMIDCQAYTDNLARFGAREIDRNRFLSELAALRSAAVIPDSWHGYDGNALLHEGLALDAENRRAGRTV
jgi:leucyl/phenylalanyl-tRNA--protein transferase